MKIWQDGPAARVSACQITKIEFTKTPLERSKFLERLWDGIKYDESPFSQGNRNIPMYISIGGKYIPDTITWTEIKHFVNKTKKWLTRRFIWPFFFWLSFYLSLTYD